MTFFAGASKAKSLFSLFLSVVLVMGLLPCSFANADPEESSQAADENLAALTDSEDVEIVEDTSAFEFIYVDSKTVALGDVEQVVIGFTEAANAEAAKLWYQKDGGELQSVSASNVADGAALYEFAAEGSSDLGTYDLVKVSWGSEEDGSAGEAAINGNTELGYSFAIVDSIVEENEEDAVSVYTIDEDGELNEADSLEEALESVEAETTVETESTDGGTISMLASFAAPRKAYAASTITVALDPGHGGSDPGASNGSLIEKTLNLKIAQYCKAKLDKQSGIKTFMTRSDDTYVGLEDRVTKAKNAGANLFVSFHINSAESVATGFEVWVQNDSSWRYSLHEQSSELGTTILSKLKKLGLTNRGNKESDSSSKYADGSEADGLSVLRNSRLQNIPAVLIEHGFINGKPTDQNLLSSESGLKSMGEADADAIIEFCSKHESELTKGEDYYAPVYDYNYYIAHNSDVKSAFNGDKDKTFQHFIEYGMNEGRRANAGFDVMYYKAAYADLQKAYGNSLKDYYLHYINYGKAEGRAAVVPEASESIMGSSEATAVQMASYYKKVVGASTYPSSVYSSKGAASIDEFAKIVYEEAEAEGVRAEVVFCQAMKETGWLKFGGSVKAEQCNFAGLGATDSNTSGATFADVRTGIRAQVQHLKAYASTGSLNNACVDPRFSLVKRGSATKLEDLNGKWAVPGTGYGQEIYVLIENLQASYAADSTQSMYRLYNPNSGEHFYTASSSERGALIKAGWKSEGIGWTAPKSSKAPVYRLYSGTDHHYTASAAEKDSLVKKGWKYEGIGWYSDDAQGVAVYRQYNPNVNPKAKRNNSGSHNYTTNKAESDSLVKKGWKYEGVAWYGVK